MWGSGTKGKQGTQSHTHLLVVPVAFLPVLRAEHTTTTRLLSTYCLFPLSAHSGLGRGGQTETESYLTISSAILSGNLPTLVPPNFCTTQPRESGFFNRDRAMAGSFTDNGGLIDSEWR
jgi:hypothetical protein